MQDPDSELVRLAQGGSREDFGKLASRYYDMVYAIAFGVLHNHEAAKDVVQEVFIKTYRDIKNFAGNSKFKTWLYRISMNASIDHVRQKRPMESLDATDVSDDDDRPPVIITDRSPGPREKLQQTDLRKLIDKAIEELSPEHRAVLVMREWQELSYEEIAETLGVQVGTVMSRLHYARKKLAEILNQELKEEKQDV